MSENEKKDTEEKGGLFKDLSISQVVAGALAAVTSMLLASQIGIAGSVIGVAVGSVVATVSSQLYKNFISASADKIREKHGDDDLGETEEAVQPGANHEAAPIQSARSGQSHTPHVGDKNAHFGDTALRKRAERQRKQKVQRGVIVVSVVSALIAVALCALVINISTAGEGIGEKTTSLIANDTAASNKTGSAASAPSHQTSPSSSATSSNNTAAQDTAGAANGNTEESKTAESSAGTTTSSTTSATSSSKSASSGTQSSSSSATS